MRELFGVELVDGVVDGVSVGDARCTVLLVFISRDAEYA
jgi:hypothetical protein